MLIYRIGCFVQNRLNFAAISSRLYPVSSISADLSGAANAQGSAGETTAASSSRSTAASQKGDEEDTAEVDELAFQNLKNYDENPQGILLPEDQQFAYDDEGNIYYIVTMQSKSGVRETFPLYRVDLDLLCDAPFNDKVTVRSRSIALTPRKPDGSANSAE